MASDDQGLWRDLRGFVDGVLDDVSQDEPQDWAFLLGTPALVTMAVVAVSLHLIEVFTVNRSGVVQTIGMAPAAVLWLLSIGAIGWAMWRVHTNAADRRPYVIIIFSSLSMIAVCLLLWSGVTVILAEQNGVVTTDGDTPSLWQVERFYVWHLLDSVPLFEIPQTVEWSEPQVVDGAGVATAIIALKLVLVLPVIRLIAAMYRFFDATRLTELERAKKREERRRRSNDSSLMPTFYDASMLWGPAGGAFLVAAIGGIVFAWAFAPGAWITRYTTENIPEDVEILGRTRSLEFVRYPHEILVAAFIAFLGYLLAIVFIEYQRERIAKPRHLCAGLAAVAGLFAVGVLLAGTIVVALYHAGIAGGDRSADVSEAVGALDLGLWHAASTIPFLDVTGTFGWEPSWSFTGRWAGVTFLLVRVATFAALIIFIPRLISSFIQEHTHRDEAGLLSLPASLSAQFEAQLAIQDRAQKEAAQEKAEQKLERTHWWVGRSSIDVPSSFALECLEAEIDGLAKVFGRGELTEKADDALTALEERSELLRRWISRRRGGYYFSLSYSSSRTQVSDAQVKDAKKRAHRRVADFKESARTEMRDASRVLKEIT